MHNDGQLKGGVHTDADGNSTSRDPKQASLMSEDAGPLIVGARPSPALPSVQGAVTSKFGLKARRPNDTKFSGERSESAATRC